MPKAWGAIIVAIIGSQAHFRASATSQRSITAEEQGKSWHLIRAGFLCFRRPS